MKFILLLFLLVSSLLFGQQSDPKLEKITLQLHWKYQFEFAGFIAAKEKGFYKDAGFDVTLREYKNGEDIVQEVLDGRADYGVYNSSIFIKYLEGDPIVLVASFFKRSALVLVTKPTIKTPKDLLGKKIMASAKEDFRLNFEPYLEAYGVKIADLHLLPHTFDVKSFVAGEVDAMTAFVSDQPYKLDKLGVAYNILDPSKENLFVLQEELFTSQKRASADPKGVEAFKKATIKGWKYALHHKQELITIIHQKYNPTIPLDVLASEADAIERLILPSAYAIGSIDRNFLVKQIQLFQKEYHIGENKDLDGFIFAPPEHKEHLAFSKKEQNYIQNHPQVKVCINHDLFPVVGLKNNKMTGEMADIFALIHDMTSLEFLPVAADSEKDLIHKVLSHQCDLLAIIATSNTRQGILKPTRPFSRTNFTLLSRLENSFIDDPQLLKGKVLLVQKEFFKRYLKKLYPYLEIHVIDDKNKMVAEVLSKRAYGIVTLDEQADYFIDKYGYGKLKIGAFLAKEHPIKGSIGVQKDQTLLYSIMDKAISHISQEKMESIRNSWRLSRYQTKSDYTLVFKTALFMGIIILIMIYYQRKLKNFNDELEKQVFAKTKELRNINESLEATVAQKIAELLQKDAILTAQSKQAVMGEMISMIAHQWRQPLNTITLQISNIELQEMMGKGLSKQELMQKLDAISQTILYLSNTIDDFKTYFHPNKQATKVVLGELMQKVQNFLEPRAKRNGVSIDVTGDQDTCLNLYANELLQVVLNIVNNAIDAYESTELLEKSIVIDVYNEPTQCTISIKDQAGGIEEKYQKQIFEPYFSTKGKNGTGLGLYMSKMIIEKQFSGTIEVFSKDGGTVFKIVIPVEPLQVQEED